MNVKLVCPDDRHHNQSLTHTQSDDLTYADIGPNACVTSEATNAERSSQPFAPHLRGHSGGYAYVIRPQASTVDPEAYALNMDSNISPVS